jgi:hypothetical protein
MSNLTKETQISKKIYTHEDRFSNDDAVNYDRVIVYVVPPENGDIITTIGTICFCNLIKCNCLEKIKSHFDKNKIKSYFNRNKIN